MHVRHRLRAGMIGAAAGAVGLTSLMALFGLFASHPAPRPIPRPGKTLGGTVPPGSTTVSKDAVPEGRLVFQLSSGLEVLPRGATRGVLLDDGQITAYEVSPDGTMVIAATYVSEPTNYTREAELLTIDTAQAAPSAPARASQTGRRRRPGRRRSALVFDAGFPVTDPAHQWFWGLGLPSGIVRAAATICERDPTCASTDSHPGATIRWLLRRRDEMLSDMVAYTG